MRLRSAVVVGGVALLAFAIPSAGSVVLARDDAEQVVKREARFYAQDALHRSNATTRQVEDAVDTLAAAGAGCDARSLGIMKAFDVSSSYVQAVGVVRGGHLVCSSVTGTDEPVDLGPVDYVSPAGASVRLDVHLPFAPEASFLVVERGGYAAVLHKALPIDVSTSDRRVALALLGRPGDHVLTGRGDFEPEWLRTEGNGTRSFVDGGRVVAVAVSDEYSLATVAAMPASALTEQLRSSMLKRVPFAMVVGLLLAGAVLLLGRRRSSLPAEIKAGLRRREFALEYQPIVDLRTRRVVGAEALLRWRRPYGIQPPPDLFIPAAERAGMMPQLTARVLELLAEDAAGLNAEHPGLHLSVNLSAADVHELATVARVRAVVDQLDLPPGQLVVEITERAIVEPDKARPVLTALREAGVLVAVDDFGTGYSSLASLQSLEVDILKIDKAFVETLGTEAATSHVVHHIIDMADALSLVMVAEGVETEEQARLLARRGVQQAQGWLFGRPVSIDVLRASLREAGALPRPRTPVVP